MAQKKQVKTPEALLDDALVPSEEQPYDVPDNWCWVRLGKINEYVSKTVNPSACPQQTFELYSVPSFADGAPERVEGSVIGSTKQVVAANDVLLCKINPRINRVWKVNDNPCDTQLASSEWVVIRSSVLSPDFLACALSASDFRRQLLSNVSGVGGSLMRAQPRFVKGYCVPLPPLAEQKRIVERVKGLFSKLEKAESKILDALASDRRWRIALLHKAFSGRLTRRWRDERGLDDATWKMKRFDEVAEIKPNLVDPADYPNMPHIAPDNIEKETGRLLQYRTVSEDGVISGKHRFHPGQILYSKIRPYLSKAIVVDFEGLCSADMYPIEARIDTQYLWLYMLSQDFLTQTFDAGSRTVLPKINMKSLSAIRVPTPTIEEQKVIAGVLTSALSKMSAVELSLKQTLQRIEELRTVVLLEALRGRLGTGDAEDPSARKELISMLQSRMADF